MNRRHRELYRSLFKPLKSPFIGKNIMNNLKMRIIILSSRFW
jgi:hypothetical protein